MWKVKIAEVDSKLKVDQIIQQVNRTLEAAEVGMTIQQLVPLWYKILSLDSQWTVD